MNARIWYATLIAVTLLSPKSVAYDSLKMIQQMIVGNTVCGRSRGGYDTCIHYKKDGTMSGRAGQYTAHGTYKIRDDGTLCVEWSDPRWDSGCTRLSPSESGHIESVDSNGDVKFTHKVLRPGDAANLH